MNLCNPNIIDNRVGLEMICITVFSMIGPIIEIKNTKSMFIWCKTFIKQMETS